MGRRVTAVAGTGLAVLLGAALVAGWGQVPHTASLSAAPDALPSACLGSGLNLALGYGAYATPVDGTAADVSATPSWRNAALQLAPVSTLALGDGPYILCSYVADHPSPFTTRGGDDTVVCVLVDPSGDATVLSARTTASGGSGADCAAAAASG